MRFVTLIVFTLCTSFLYAQAEWPKPKWEKVEAVGCRHGDKTVTSTVGKYEVRIGPAADSKSNEDSCRAYLSGFSGAPILLLEDWAVSIHQGTGWDLFGDGNPGLILEGYSGGAHCCYTYKMVDLGDRPLLLPSIENQSPFFAFKDKASGGYRIMTSDGAFDYFDGMCHACAPLPRVVLQVTRSALRDVSPQFVDQYDSEIAQARAKIGEGNIGKFLAADFEDAKGTVLEIVYSYLYSGREAEAWHTLDEMWPAKDRQRMKDLIMRTRAEGLLSKLAKTKPE